MNAYTNIARTLFRQSDLTTNMVVKALTLSRHNPPLFGNTFLHHRLQLIPLSCLQPMLSSFTLIKRLRISRFYATLISLHLSAILLCGLVLLSWVEFFAEITLVAIT
ncbi:hypothetical protein BT96DRAFT_400040 [Gymnopus androsaceus JB14]|uniref:Uncharacterized protein n=1 Tax=Gymnopus androsaceus JB14 TaxID=1447944 RepID=A0A6A4GWN1_9AGAR|nr:hypothetical protein BT96DRAFT_400040 [Gymnopus androsaceus JB14]